jgi:hypothetical protein
MPSAAPRIAPRARMFGFHNVHECRLVKDTSTNTHMTLRDSHAELPPRRQPAHFSKIKSTESCPAKYSMNISV